MLTLIAAVDMNNGIGKAGAIPWRQKNDMQHFKGLTWGHTVLMGRVTYEGMPALKGRKSIVITSRSMLSEGDLQFINPEYLDTYLKLNRDLICIGGGKLYAALINKADRLILTRIHCDAECDTFFPAIDNLMWRLVATECHRADENNQYDYDYLTYVRH